jgi:hypothetical protein
LREHAEQLGVIARRRRLRLVTDLHTKRHPLRRPAQPFRIEFFEERQIDLIENVVPGPA